VKACCLSAMVPLCWQSSSYGGRSVVEGYRLLSSTNMTAGILAPCWEVDQAALVEVPRDGAGPQIHPGHAHHRDTGSILWNASRAEEEELLHRR